MGLHRIWLGLAFLWEQYRRIPVNQQKAFVHAILGASCLGISAESQDLIANATLQIVQSLANLIGAGSILLGLINALHKPEKPANVIPIKTEKDNL